MKSISISPTFSLVTVSLAGMAVFALIDQAEAGKGIQANGSGTYKVGPIAGGVSKLPKPPTTGTVKANPPPRPWGCHHPANCGKNPGSARPGPRVVPKEDLPQKVVVVRPGTNRRASAPL
jgi:hypothetical protein